MDNINVSLSNVSITQGNPDGIIPQADLSIMKISDFHTLETTKGGGIKIAILDTGCLVTHSALSGKIAGVKNFTPDDGGVVSTVTDYNGQGTLDTGIISATNALYPGAAEGAQVYILKVYGQGGGNVGMINNAIIHAINLNVDAIVINVSIGSINEELRALTESAVKQGIAVISGGANSGDGNAATDEISYPACFSHVIGVGSSHESRYVLSSSGTNNQVDIVAYGNLVLSSYTDGSFGTITGTAASASYIGAAYALMKKYLQTKLGRTVSYNEVYAHLMKRTLDLNENIKKQGNGMLYMTGDVQLRQSILGS
ncbi:MAG: S8 family serine peptidase [Clostridium sp.]